MTVPSNRQSYYPPISEEPTPVEMAIHLKNIYTAINDHDQAIEVVNAKSGTATSTTTTVIQQINGGGGSNFVVGGVNNQLGQASYTTTQADYGVKIIAGNSTPVTINLNSAVTTPWFVVIDNDSSAVTNLVPTTGSIFGLSAIPSQGFAIVYFDGTNFWSGVSSGFGSTIQKNSYTAKTSNYAINATTDYQVECTSGTFTVTLPTAAGIVGQSFSIKNSGAGTITVATTGGQTIDGSATQTLTPLDNLVVMSNGGNWIIL